MTSTASSSKRKGSNPTALLALLQGGAPKTAQIDSMTTQELPLCDDETQFQIVPSQESAAVQTRIGPDVVPCEACLSEVCDPSSRRLLVSVFELLRLWSTAHHRASSAV